MAECRFFNREHVQASLVQTTDTGRKDCGVLVFRGTAGGLTNWRFNRDIVTGLPPAGHWPHFVHAGLIVKNAGAAAERGLVQAPALLADHAPLNYTTQLPVAFGP